jgi:hypothetical protein
VVEVSDPDVDVGPGPAYLTGQVVDDHGKSRIAAAVRGDHESRHRAGAHPCRPHSTFGKPSQRPSRPWPRWVHGAQPIEP